jgi:hypothetical protein
VSVIKLSHNNGKRTIVVPKLATRSYLRFAYLQDVLSEALEELVRQYHHHKAYGDIHEEHFACSNSAYCATEEGGRLAWLSEQIELLIKWLAIITQYDENRDMLLECK